MQKFIEEGKRRHIYCCKMRRREEKQMLNYKEFIEKVKKEMLLWTSKETQDIAIGIKQLVYNNDQIKYVLEIAGKGKTSLIIHLESYYNDYQSRGDFNLVFHEIVKCYTKEKNRNILDFDIGDYNEVKRRLFIELLNKEKNRKYLQEGCFVSVPNTNLVAAVRVLCSVPENTMASFLVKNDNLKMWEISKQEIYEDALQNTSRLFPAQIMDIGEIVQSINPDLKINKELPQQQVFVLSNEQIVRGAATILYPDILQKIAEEKDSNFFVLPSSIHEVILSMDNEITNAERWKSMVMDINRTCLEPEDFLSDEVYFYDRKKKELIMPTSVTP